MQDPAFKRLFGHPAAIEGLVRTYAPERASRIDFSTLEKLDAELVGEALLRRYPDALWTAHTRGRSRRVVILLEFQGTQDPLMALRIAVYQLLSVQVLHRRMRLSRPDRSLEVVSFVLYHGKGQWKAPTQLRKLFKRWVAGDYRVIPAPPDEGSTEFKGDLAGTILALERERSVEGTRAALGELRRIAEETGSDFNRFMARCVAEMLVSKGRITMEQMREVTTMAQVSTEYERSLEEFGRRWFRQGRDEGFRQGRDEGQVAMLSQFARRKFGPEAAEKLAALVGDLPDADRISEAASAVFECATAEEYLARIGRGQPT